MKLSKYGTPLDVKFCARCVISNQRPNSTIETKSSKNTKKVTIAFDTNGVCDACRFAEYKDTKINWDEREKGLRKLCDKYRRSDGYYDCIVPGSGGKDSCFASHILKTKYGMNPLTVTWAPHYYTEIGWRNFTNWIHNGGFDNILFTPNGVIHRTLTRLAFENLLHPFQPFIIGQRSFAAKLAVKYKIPLIFYGENQAEYGNNIKENDTPTANEDFYSTNKINLKLLFLGGVSVSELIKKRKLRLQDLNPYLPVEKREVRELNLKAYYLSYFLKWDPQENYYYAAREVGFQANTERTEGTYSKYSSIDDKIDYFHYYTTLIKFGIGRATYDTSQEIRNKKITREEGVALVRRYDQEFPHKYFGDFLEYIGISEKKFFTTIDKFRPRHLWRKENGKWKLLHQVS